MLQGKEYYGRREGSCTFHCSNMSQYRKSIISDLINSGILKT